MKFPATAVEARARLAWFFYRTNQMDRARALVDEPSAVTADPNARYLAGLIRGQVLRAQGEFAAAAAAFRDAMRAVPGAQSARVALMTVLLSAGDRQEAESLARSVQTPGESTTDPWWSYWLGDVNDYPARLSRLRELGR
jgi:predicted Zn-dependent protease